MKAEIIGLIVAAVLLYFPYVWCRIRHEDEKEWGLTWYMGRGAWRDVLFALALTLIPLTFVSMYWPAEWGQGGPHAPTAAQIFDRIGGGVAAAFIEETFFRGWLQTLLTRRVGPRLGILLATLCFALSHLIVLTGWLRVATFFPGLIMAILRHRNGSVLPGIIYHAVCNVWAVWWAPIP